jgi:hypothetical protein
VKQRLLQSIGIVSVIAAVAVPSALAVRPAQDDAGPVATSVSSDPSVVARHAALGRLESAPQQVTVRPDDKAGVRPSEPSSIVAVASTDNGFEWGDAAVGAGGAIGLFLLIGLATAVVQRNRKRPLTA